MFVSVLPLSVACAAQPSSPMPPQRRAPATKPAGGTGGAGGTDAPKPATQPGAKAAPVGSKGPILGLWVNRWDYKTPDDIDLIMERASSLGVTDLFWQVRGQADAFYPSALEPWGEEICTKTAQGLKSPTFDPLRVAIERAHARNIRLHAWFNVMPMWKGTKAPLSQNHIYYKHANFRVADATGKPQALNDHYVTVNFTMPEVQDHIAAVARDIVSRYSIDGLHLDYVRFVSESSAASLRLLEDPATLSRFTAETDLTLTAENRAKNFGKLHDWRRSKITTLVRRIRKESQAIRPGLQLTAAVWRTPATARDYDQDSAAWLNDGYLDAAYPMIYTDKDDQFTKDLSEWTLACPGKLVVPGLGIYQHAPGKSAYQVSVANRLCPRGLALYAYASLYESADPKQDRKPQDVKTRSERLQALKAIVRPAAANSGVSPAAPRASANDAQR